MWLDPLEDVPENLRLKVVTTTLVSSDGPDAASATGATEARELVEQASALWESLCGISLVHAGHEIVEAGPLGLNDSPVGRDQMDEIQEAFYDPSAIRLVFIRNITVDPDKVSAISGSCSFPWHGEKAILLTDFASYQTVAHELGHFLGLPHVGEDGWEETEENNFRNLMYPVLAGFDDYELASVQCKEAKRYILEHAALRDVCRPDSPDPELNCGE